MSDSKQPMTGERSENSVLFSLAHLQRLGSAERTSRPQREFPVRDSAGSGLIDIRSMTAAAQRRAPAGTDEVAVNATPGRFPQLPAVGVLMPIAPGDRPWWLVPSLVLGGALVVTAVALLAALLLQEHPPEVRTPSTFTPARASTPHTGRAAAAPSGVNADQPRTPQVVAARVEPVSTDSAERSRAQERDRQPLAKRRADRNNRRPTRKKLRQDRLPRDVERRPDRPPTPGPRSIVDILGDVGKRPVTRPKPGAAGAMPRTLSRTDIHGGLRRVMGSALRCGRRFGTSGAVSVRLIVKGDTGAVVSATPKGRFASTESGRCVARTLQSAKFRKFQAARYSFYYTVILR
ncbi:MAG: hypothetical protein ABI333_26295 [bacterium]